MAWIGLERPPGAKSFLPAPSYWILCVCTLGDTNAQRQPRTIAFFSTFYIPHPHTLTHTFTYTCARTSTHTQTQAVTLKHTDTRTHICTHVHSHIHTHIPARAHVFQQTTVKLITCVPRVYGSGNSFPFGFLFILHFLFFKNFFFFLLIVTVLLLLIGNI